MRHLATVRLRQMHEVAALFAKALADRVGCTPEDIRERGLDAGAFRGDQEVRVSLADGSTMHLRYAFFVENEDDNIVGVFSEHGGYHFFPRVDLSIEQLDAGTVVASRNFSVTS